MGQERKDLVYIHAFSDDWVEKRSSIHVSDRDVQEAFTSHKERYSQGNKLLFRGGDLNKAKKSYQKLYHYISQANEVNPEAFDKSLQDYVKKIVEEMKEKGVTRTKLPGTSKAVTNIGFLGQSNLEELINGDVGQLFKLWKSVHEIMASIMNEESQALLKSKGYLRPDEVEKINTAVDSLDKMIKMENSGKTVEEILAQSKKTSHNLRTAWRGGFNEFYKNLGLASSKTLQDELKQSQKAIKGVTALIENTGGQFENGQKLKADNAIIIDYQYSGNKSAGKAFLGISEKASKMHPYKWGAESRAGRSSLMGGTNYERLFAEVSNKDIERYFCNEYVHFKASFMDDPTNLIQKYITAKAASYALSGSNDEKMTYFLHAGDQLVYIPKLLERLSSAATEGSEGIMRLSINHPDVGSPKPKKDMTAEARSEMIYGRIKKRVKFSMGIASDQFWSLMGL